MFQPVSNRFVTFIAGHATQASPALPQTEVQKAAIPHQSAFSSVVTALGRLKSIASGVLAKNDRQGNASFHQVHSPNMPVTLATAGIQSTETDSFLASQPMLMASANHATAVKKTQDLQPRDIANKDPLPLRMFDWINEHCSKLEKTMITSALSFAGATLLRLVMDLSAIYLLKDVPGFNPSLIQHWLSATHLANFGLTLACMVPVSWALFGGSFTQNMYVLKAMQNLLKRATSKESSTIRALQNNLDSVAELTTLQTQTATKFKVFRHNGAVGIKRWLCFWGKDKNLSLSAALHKRAEPGLHGVTDSDKSWGIMADTNLGDVLGFSFDFSIQVALSALIAKLFVCFGFTAMPWHVAFLGSAILTVGQVENMDDLNLANGR